MRSTAKIGKPAGLLLLALAVAVPAFRGGACSSGFCLTLLSQALAPTLSAAALPAQIWNRDPLTEEEADKLREAAAEPDKRISLLVEFATTRMAKVDEARSHPKPAATHAQRIHDALDEFGRVMDEIDDNVDDYESRKMDMRKGLAQLIEADTIFQSKLAELAADSAAPDPNGTGDYHFVLEDDVDIVKSQLERAKEVLKEQERRIQEEKERQKQRDQKKSAQPGETHTR
jgi:hypothetical protein